MYDLFVDDDQPDRQPGAASGWHARRSAARHVRGGSSAADAIVGGPAARSTPWRSEVVERLEREGLAARDLLPLQPAGCDEAVHQCLHVRACG